MKKIHSLLSSFLVEVIVYGVLVTGYFFAVLHFLGDWLLQLFRQHRTTYAFLSLGLIIGQGFLLEMLTRFLLRFIKPEAEAPDRRRRS